MPLRDVLDAFEHAGPLSLSQLARRLDVEPTTLDGMIQFWVNKGKLRVADTQNCTDCGARHSCPLLTAVPRRYERVAADSLPIVESLPCEGKR